MAADRIMIGFAKVSAGRRAIVRMLAVLCVVVIGHGARAQGAFYQATPAELAGPPGTVIRQEPLGLRAPNGAAAYRVLYRSTGLHDEPIAVSGVVIVPSGPPPANG